MTSRVTPSVGSSNEANETRGHGFSGEGSVRVVVTDAAGRLTHKLGPVLKAMRIFGMFCGETNFNLLPSCKGPRFYGTLYCGLIVALMWFSVFEMVISLFYHDVSKLVNLLHILQFLLWHLICAGSATVCLYVLPVGRKNASPFEKFLRHIISNHGNINFSPKSTKKLVATATFAIVFNLTFVVLFTAVGLESTVLFEPWVNMPIYVIIHPVFVMLSSGTWLYPIILVCSVCSILVDAIDDLGTRVTLAIKEKTLDIDQLRKEHNELCQTVEYADKAIAPLILAKVCGHVPLLALICYKLAKFPAITSQLVLAYFIASLLWSVASIVVLSALLINASRVNEKLHGFGKILQQSYFSNGDTKESCELLMFLLHLQDEPLGLTVGGFVVITKSFSMTVLGVLVSYITVLLSLPQ